MKMKKRNLLVLASIMMLVGVAVAVVMYHFHFRQRLILVSPAKIQVYYDQACTQEFKQGDTLDWGEHSSTETLTKTLWIKNTGSVNVTLRFDWDRGQHPWMTMSWDYDGSKLEVGQVKQVIISLDMPDEIGGGEFWWDGWFEAIPA